MLSKKVFLSKMLVLLIAKIFSQEIILSGKIKGVNDGKIFLVSAWNPEIYPDAKPLIDSAIIRNNTFEFKKNKHYLKNHPYYLQIRSTHINNETGVLFIGEGNEQILIDTIDPHIAPINLDSDMQKEVKNIYEPTFSKVIHNAITLNLFIDSLYESGKKVSLKDDNYIDETVKSITNTADSLLFQYTVKYPNSLVSFWKLNERYYNNSFKWIYKKTFDVLSPTIRNSNIGESFSKELVKSSILSTNTVFPEVFFKNPSNKDFYISTNSFLSKYTFVNFWFSNCKPCLTEFPSLIKLTKKYTPSFFSIINISTDDKADLQQWKKIIVKFNNNFIDLWDENKVVSDRFRIHRFPSNVLVDDKGVIIKKNLTMTELIHFMEDSYKKSIFFDDSSEPK